MSGGKSQMQQTAVCYHAQLPLFLQQLAQTPPVQRLRQVGMSCGCEYTQFPPFVHSTPYSRYEHSLGVALIVWHFTGNRAQAAAGLLHDAATPTFAHVVDFLLGDHLRQEATEAGTHDVLAASAPLLSVLGRWGLPLSAVENYHQYPIADNALPRLSADRLEYTLGNLLHYGFCGAEELQGWYDDIVQAENEQGVPELAFPRRSLGIGLRRQLCAAHACMCRMKIALPCRSWRSCCVGRWTWACWPSRICIRPSRRSSHVCRRMRGWLPTGKPLPAIRR